MKKHGLDQSQGLESAFTIFSEVSEQLVTSYRDLENRVSQLTAELNAVRKERLVHLQERRRVANRMARLLDALPAGVIVLDGSGMVQDCNPAAQELLGESLLGEAWHKVIARVFAPRSHDGHEVSLRNGRLVSISTSPLGSEPGQILLLKDVTEARVLQDKLSRHQRLSAMGRMAASLAHQVRTPLSSALLYTSHLARSEISPSDRKRFAEKSLRCLQHLEQLVRDMLDFARGGCFEAAGIVVPSLLEMLRENTEPQLSSGRYSLDIIDNTDGALIKGNQEALLAALQNIVNNSIQACNGDGKLVLEARILDDLNGTQVIEISLVDDGPGIPEEIKFRIFEPFFTTRVQGTGLGLAVVQTIIGAHGGSIWVESEQGEGCAFKMHLPAATEDGVVPCDSSKGKKGNAVAKINDKRMEHPSSGSSTKLANHCRSAI